MHETLQFLVRHGYAVVFFWVLIEQVGLPVPAMPVLLAAGSLTALGGLRMPTVLGLGVLACLVADGTWFTLGRIYGGRVLRLLCRISLEPDSCVRRTDDLIAKYGARLLLFSKFVPGLNTVAVPIAGRSRISVRRFLVFDVLGSILWIVVFVVSGRIFGRTLEKTNFGHLPLGQILMLLAILAVGGYIGIKVRQRRKFIFALRVAKISPEELRQMIEQDKHPFIVDLRHPLDLLPDPRTIPGALKLSPEELELRIDVIPRDRDIVLFCTCPSEATSARVALKLKKFGISRVRPLEGGFYQWRELGFPLEGVFESDARAV